jgi:hypothetical protein
MMLLAALAGPAGACWACHFVNFDHDLQRETIGATLRKPQQPAMTKAQMREESDRLVKEALARKLTVTQGKTRLDVKCSKCGAANRTGSPSHSTTAPGCDRDDQIAMDRCQDSRRYDQPAIRRRAKAVKVRSGAYRDWGKNLTSSSERRMDEPKHRTRSQAPG